MGYLISETTKEEREQMARQSEKVVPGTDREQGIRRKMRKLYEQ